MTNEQSKKISDSDENFFDNKEIRRLRYYDKLMEKDFLKNLKIISQTHPEVATALMQKYIDINNESFDEARRVVNEMLHSK